MALQVKNLPAMQEMQELWAPSLGWEDAPEAEMATHSSILGRSRFDPWVMKIPWSILAWKKWHGNPLQYSCLENTMDRGSW